MKTKVQASRLAIVALGSNLGDSAATIRLAINRLRAFADGEFLQSSLWQTSPVDCPPGSPPFVNAVVGFVPAPDETPEALHAKLQSLEKEFGRQPKRVLNEARPLDLDLIAFGTEVRGTPALSLPHPRAHLRQFVLQPLAEIAPNLILPGQGQTVLELLQDLATSEQLTRLAG
jgi:2-amino-4-hydroxy-6-hydroxymethyldihydropteridine diphosphokinase